MELPGQWRWRCLASHHHCPGSSIEVCEGPYGHHQHLSAGRVVSRNGRDLRHDPQDRQAGHRPRRGRRAAVWAPGEYLVIDWGNLGGVKVFCAVLAWSRVRFVRFAADEQATTTMAMLAECFEVIGGVPAKVLADRMGCLKGGVVANVVVPTGDYVNFAGHYGFAPDFCNAADPASKGIVENLVDYGKSDLLVPLLVDQPTPLTAASLAQANTAAIAWCTQVNAAVHSQIA